MKKFASLAGIGFALALEAAALPALAEGSNPAAEPAPSTAVQAVPGPCAPGTSFQDRAAARLGLSDAQKASWKAIFDKHQASLAQKRQAAGAARQAFQEAYGRPGTDPDTLRQLHRAQADLAFEARLERRALRQELRAVLTPEQRERAAFWEGRMEARRWGRGGGPGPGPMARVRRGLPPMPGPAPAPAPAQ